jgi:hypothetical protein
MTNADRRAVLGCAMALIGGAILLADLWAHWRMP